MFDLSIGTIEHGWTDIEMIVNDHPVLIVFEYTPNDALYDLLISALQLVYYRNYSSKIVFPYNPDVEVLYIEKTGNNACKVSINKWSEELSVKQHVRKTLKMFDKYIYAHSKDEYENEWRHLFPTDDLKRLRQQYRTL